MTEETTSARVLFRSAPDLQERPRSRRRDKLRNAGFSFVIACTISRRETYDGAIGANDRRCDGGPNKAGDGKDNMSVSEASCGIVSQHIHAIEAVAREKRTFILLRFVNPYATGLIAAGYRTKKLDMHAKSSDWGPMAGFVCVDSELSKSVDDGTEAVRRNSRAITSALEKENARRIPLTISRQRIEELVARNLFTESGTGIAFNASSRTGKKTVRFEFVADSHQNQMYRVRYFPNGATHSVDVEVMAYAENGNTLPVTADYDVFAICPHFTAPDFSPENATHFRETAEQGLLSRIQQTIISSINSRCGGAHRRVVNHGTELNNPSPEKDRELVMFTPGGTSRIISRFKLPDLCRELAMRGFYFYTNTHWHVAFKSQINSRMSQLQVPGRRGSSALKVLTEDEVDHLDIKQPDEDGKRTAFERQKFSEEVVFHPANGVRPPWR